MSPAVLEHIKKKAKRDTRDGVRTTTHTWPSSRSYRTCTVQRIPHFMGFSVHFFVGFWKSIFPQIPITARASIIVRRYQVELDRTSPQCVFIKRIRIVAKKKKLRRKEKGRKRKNQGCSEFCSQIEVLQIIVSID